MNTGMSENAVDTMLNAIRSSTQKQYSVYINKFLHYCQNTNITLASITEITIINFLQTLYDNGCGYSVINTANSAICYVLSVLGFPLTSTIMLTKFKKGIFNLRPSLPRYTATWNPQIVLDYFSSNNDSSMQFVAYKAVVLLALASCCRVSTIHSIKYCDMLFDDDKVFIQLNELQKQSRPGYHQSGMELQRFANKDHCVVEALEQYLTLTKSIREQLSTITNLFITTSKPYKNASKDTLARWIKTTLHKAGVPTEYTAHSTRSAATSDLLKKGVDVATILGKGGWSSCNTFYKFYKRC